MSAWYGFQHPTHTSAIMDPAMRVPDAEYNGTIKEQVEHQLGAPREELIPCCTKPPPCHTWIQWKPQLSECPPTFLPWHYLTGGKFDSAEIGQKDSRIWVSNLNALHYERGLVSGAEWWAESTKPHIRNRQQFAQYLQSTLYPTYTPHEKRIDRVEDAYALMRQRFGPNGIQYTSF